MVVLQFMHCISIYSMYSTHTVCVYAVYISCRCIVVCLHSGQTVDTYWPAFTYPCGGEEEGMEPYCCDDRTRFSQCEAQMGSHMGAEVVGSVAWIPSRCLVRVPCCAQTYTYPRAAALAHLV